MTIKTLLLHSLKSRVLLFSPCICLASATNLINGPRRTSHGMTPEATSRLFSFYLGLLVSGEIQQPCRNLTKEFSGLYKQGHFASPSSCPPNIHIMNAYEYRHLAPFRPAQVSAKYHQETSVNPTWNARITHMRPT